MIPIKILCGCGQKYSFDVEPVGGQMPWAVACPICGTDGTPAANMAIAQSIPAAPLRAVAAPAAAVAVAAPATAVAPPPPALRISAAPQSHTATAPAPPPPAPPARLAAPPPTAPAAPNGRKLLPGQLDPAQAQIEAKAKISWGDPPEEVIKYLLLQGFTREEATPFVQQLFNERARTVRKNGIGKMIVGTGMLFVPLVFYFIFASANMMMFPVKIFAITVMVGLWGLGKVLKGIFMFVSPRTERGDVASH